MEDWQETEKQFLKKKKVEQINFEQGGRIISGYRCPQCQQADSFCIGGTMSFYADYEKEGENFFIRLWTPDISFASVTCGNCDTEVEIEEVFSKVLEDSSCALENAIAAVDHPDFDEGAFQRYLKKLLE